MDLLEDLPSTGDTDYWQPKSDKLLSLFQVLGPSTPEKLRAAMKSQLAMSTVVLLNVIAYASLQGSIQYDRATGMWSRKDAYAELG